MPRILNREELEREYADKHGLTPREIKKIIQSQFQTVEAAMKEGLFKAVRLKYFGVFQVHPTTKARILNGRQSDSEVSDS